MSTSNYQTSVSHADNQAKISLLHLITELDTGGAQVALLRLLTHLNERHTSGFNVYAIK